VQEEGEKPAILPGLPRPTPAGLPLAADRGGAEGVTFGNRVYLSRLKGASPGSSPRPSAAAARWWRPHANPPRGDLCSGG